MDQSDGSAPAGAGGLITEEMRGAIEAAIGRHIKHWQEGGLLARGLVSGMTDDALEAIEPMLGKLILKRCAEEVSLGSDWQVEDPRMSYVDVQVDKDFYMAIRATEA